MFDKIINIASIQSGYHFIEKIENDKKGAIQFIQLKDIDEYNRIDYSNLLRNNLPNIRQTQFLEKGDVLIKCRGISFTSAVIDVTIENGVATSHFFVLRIIDKNLILPEYLSWFLNDVPTQRSIKTGIGGTHMQVLNKKFLSEINIMIPPIEIQQKIVYLKKLNEHEQKLLLKKVECKKLLMDLQLRKIINKG
ncbi:MAG: restriction endonuclease subunit S [Candidatus Kapabacteria bacterium]|nr:restriction endonuclease subunit S [Candidatus Kapabacteria bacterium]